MHDALKLKLNASIKYGRELGGCLISQCLIFRVIASGSPLPFFFIPSFGKMI